MTAKIALIVEWDNARLSEVDRAREMLRRVSSQAALAARQSKHRFDLVLVYDPETIAPEIPRAVLAECVDERAWPGHVSLLEAPGQHYYEQKNFGVRHVDADIIILIDSDVIPDDGWLEQLLRAMRDPAVQVVSGETYLATDTYYDRLLAAFWLFETKKQAQGVYEARNFYANNVAFRGDVIRRHPFPAAETYRGQCATLAKTLRSEGIRLYRAGSAMVSHPPPSGLSHFINRAICHGHDIVLSNRNKKVGWLLASPVGALYRLVRDVATAPGRVIERRKASVGSFSGAILAFVLAVAYAAIKFVGEIVTFLSPRFVRRRFSI